MQVYSLSSYTLQGYRLRNHLNKEHPELKTSPAVCRKRKRISSNGDDYVVSNWKQHDTDDANALLAEFILEAALPFSVTSHPAFLKWIAKDNKDYTPANRASISGEHLDRVYNNTKEQVEDYVKHSSVVLGVDQSTDGAHEPIAHITVVTTDSTELLWKEIPHYTEEHTAENLMTHLSACVDELEKLGSSVSGIINDNEPKSGAVRQKFHEKYHDKIVFTPGDAPHALQLVVRDIIEKVESHKKVNDNAIFVADKFKNTRLRMFLKEELELPDRRISTNMPVITRWGTHLKMYQTLVKYKNEFIAVVNKPEAKQYVSDELKKIVSSAVFWTSLEIG